MSALKSEPPNEDWPHHLRLEFPTETFRIDLLKINAELKNKLANNNFK